MKNKIEKKSKTKILKKGDAIQCTIKHVGAPIINHGEVHEVGKNIVALHIDLKSKYCEIGCLYGDSDGTCGVYVYAGETSLNLNEEVKRDEPTIIEFPDFVGWNIFASAIGRYTLSVCLTRKTTKK